MNTAQDCLDLLLPDFRTRPAGVYILNTPQPYGAKTTIRFTLNDTGTPACRSLIIEQLLDRSQDAPRAVRLRNPEAYAPRLEVSWGVAALPGDGLHVFAYDHTILGVSWTQPMDEMTIAGQIDAKGKLHSYLVNLIRQDYAYEG